MVKHQQVISAAGLSAALVLVAGCSANIVYKPISGTAPAAASTVVLRVLDERPADQGGADKRVIGKVRGSYGIPASVTDSNPNVVVDTVSQATADALAQAGVGVGTDGLTLVATVMHYWMDGYVGYKGTVTVNYALLDAAGASSWSKQISGASGGSMIFDAGDMTKGIFEAALSDLAKHAWLAFQAAEFQQALK